MENNTYYSNECPYCGAPMNISTDQKTFACEYCGKKIIVSKQKNSTQIRLQRQNRRLALIITLVSVAVVAFSVVCFSIASTAVKNEREKKQQALIKTADPFEGISVVLDDYAPYGTLKTIKNTTKINSIEYNADKLINLSNGDVITIKAEPKDGYTWTRDTYTYTVSGLDTVVTSEDQIPADDIPVLHEFCTGKIEEIWSDVKRNNPEETIDYEIEPYKLYFNVRKESSYSYDNTITNSTYKVNFTVNGISGTMYHIVSIPDTYIRADGTFKAGYERAVEQNGSVWLDEYGINVIELISGYKTVLEMESYMDNLDGYVFYK